MSMFFIICILETSTLIVCASKLNSKKEKMMSTRADTASWFITDWIHSCTKSHQVESKQTLLRLIKEVGISFPERALVRIKMESSF